MKLKQLFCRHKKLTAVGIYEKPYDVNKLNGSICIGRTTHVICKCDRCEKEFEYRGGLLQDLRNMHKKQINIDKVFNHELWGKWW